MAPCVSLEKSSCSGACKAVRYAYTVVQHLQCSCPRAYPSLVSAIAGLSFPGKIKAVKNLKNSTRDELAGHRLAVYTFSFMCCRGRKPVGKRFLATAGLPHGASRVCRPRLTFLHTACLFCSILFCFILWRSASWGMGVCIGAVESPFLAFFLWSLLFVLSLCNICFSRVLFFFAFAWCVVYTLLIFLRFQVMSRVASCPYLCSIISGRLVLL